MFLTLTRIALVALAGASLLGACRSASPARTSRIAPLVVFVCDHGNVKSLIAASLFNQMAAARGLPVRAESRGLNPEEGVPAPIAAALTHEGIDLSTFRSRALSREDAKAADRVIAIGVDLASFRGDAGRPIEEWMDVPPASVDYPASRAALVRHIEALLGELQGKRPK